jgi:hypothetical protein
MCQPKNIAGGQNSTGPMWGLPGGNLWLPLGLSHRVVGAPEPPSVTSASVQETTRSRFVTTAGRPRGVCEAQCRSPPRHYYYTPAPCLMPLGPPFAAGGAPGGPTHS